eukprot:86087-Karenia_brevis.AAC.1
MRIGCGGAHSQRNCTSLHATNSGDINRVGDSVAGTKVDREWVGDSNASVPVPNTGDINRAESPVAGTNDGSVWVGDFDASVAVPINSFGNFEANVGEERTT